MNKLDKRILNAISQRFNCEHCGSASTCVFAGKCDITISREYICMCGASFFYYGYSTALNELDKRSRKSLLIKEKIHKTTDNT